MARLSHPAGLDQSQRPSEGLDKDLEKSTTEKAKIAAEVKKAFGWMRDSVGALTDADLGKAIKLFGNDSTTQSALFQAALHMHEHLGQSIAYARASGTTPPWSKGNESYSIS